MRRWGWASTGAATCALSGALACVSVPGSLVAGKLEALKIEPRDVRIDEIEVVDARSEADKQALSPSVRYVVPLLIWWQWASAGDVRPGAAEYTADLPGEVRTLVDQALEQSGLLAKSPSPNARKLRLKVVVDHLYGVTHVDSSFLFAVVSASSEDRIFAPYGFASADVHVSDEAGHELALLHVQGSSDPDATTLIMPGASGSETEMQLTQAAAEAAGSLATHIVVAVEPLLRGDALVTPLEPFEQRSAFFISKLTDDGAFLEVASIESASGRVMSDTVLKRWMEPYGAPGEWVVDPYQGGRARLSSEQYQQLVSALRGAYDVRFVSDVRTAHFFGSRHVEKKPSSAGLSSARGQ